MRFTSRKAMAGIRRAIEFNARRNISSLPHLRDAIQRYLSQTESTGCSYSDYWRLYSYVRRHRPVEILELGTGVSTVALAVAVADNQKEGFPGRVTSMEEHARWHDLACRIFPVEFAEHVQIRLSATVLDGFSVFRGMRYRDVPERPYDFVFVDGPAYDAPDGDKTCDFDLVRVLMESKQPVSALIDTRVSTVYVLQQLLGVHRVRYCPIRTLGIVSPSTASDVIRIDPTTPSSTFSESYRPFGRTILRMSNPSSTR